MVYILEDEKVNINKEDLIKKMTKGAYEECKNKTKEEGTLVGTGCACKKLANKDWQRKFIT